MDSSKAAAAQAAESRSFAASNLGKGGYLEGDNRAVAKGLRTVQRMMDRHSGVHPVAVLQRKPDNKSSHENFLKQEAEGKDFTSDKDYCVALLCARILDTHVHKVRDPKLRPKEITGLLGYLPSFPLDRDPAYYHDLLRKYLTNTKGTVHNQLNWAPPVILGGYLMGTGVVATFKDGKHPEGNPTDKAVPWMERLRDRRDGSGTLYVMGHLLNADLGGPSLDYNYTPLTGRAGFYGANGANKMHSEMIEQIAKQKVGKIGEGVSEVKYMVTANYGRAPRSTQIEKLQSGLEAMDTIAQEMEDEHEVELKGQLMRMDKDTKAILRSKVEGNSHLLAGLNAVTSSNYWMRSWASLKELLAGNIALWKLEDGIVPASLKAKLWWEQDGIAQDLSYEIPIDLPSSLDAAYRGTIKSGGKGDDPVKHKSQYADFLLKHVKSDHELNAKVAAFLLDRQQYEVDQILDLLEQWDRLPALQEKSMSMDITEEERMRCKDEINTIYEVGRQYADSIKGLGVILKNEAARVKLQAMASAKPKDKSMDYVSAMDEYSGGLDLEESQKTKFQLTGKTLIGGPEQVLVKFAPNGHPEGSSASGSSEWMSRLEQRRLWGATTLYVRGHMLNRHLGGPGLDWNMVPLTGNAGWYGANNANAIHSSGIEELVKKLYERLRRSDSKVPGAVTALEYRVKAVFGNHGRPQTKVMNQAWEDFKKIETHLKKVVLEKNKKLNPDQVRNSFVQHEDPEFYHLVTTNLVGGQRMLLIKLHEADLFKYGPGDPTQQPLRGKIWGDYGFKDDVNHCLGIYFGKFIRPKLPEHMKLGQAKVMLSEKEFRDQSRKALSEQDEGLVKAIASNGGLVKAIQGSCGTDGYEEYSLHEIGYRLDQNMRLWNYEDQHVPLGLETAARWRQDGQDQARSQWIPNVLPSDVRADYDPRDEDL